MGCFAKGCLTVLILGFLFLAAVIGCSWYVYHQLSTNNLISDAPVDVHLEPPTDVQLAAAKSSLAQIKNPPSTGQETTITFTAADLNALMNKDDLPDTKNEARIDIQNSTMTITSSVPLDMLTSMKGRWFNSTIRLRGGYESGLFRIRIESVRGGDYEVPGFIISSINSAINQSLNENRGNWDKDELGAEFWSHVKSIRLEGDKLLVTTLSD
ncbi:MAG: hypothetical protein DLM73_16065 [Chthoniobacterales bacterium]|nr:MAG: hypothetical protein DLM73_16065 [Chthoniobacterales bacterium]